MKIGPSLMALCCEQTLYQRRQLARQLRQLTQSELATERRQELIQTERYVFRPLYCENGK